MAQSHPPSLLTLARRVLCSSKLRQSGDTLLLAVSGGRDSMALLHAVAALNDELGFKVVAHGVDHGLREAASVELDRAAEFAAQLQVPFSRSRVSLERGGNLQARAREARYMALARAAREFGASWLATAHHADDRAETVLIRLLRGGALGHLGVLCAQSDGEDTPVPQSVIRPLIFARRSDVDSHVARHRIPFSDDPSNADPRYLRTRVRRELIPMLENLSPGIVGHLVNLAEQAAARSEEAVGTELFARFGLGRAQAAALTEMLVRPHGGERLKLKGGFELLVERRDRTKQSARQAVNPTKKEGIAAPGGANSRKSG